MKKFNKSQSGSIPRKVEEKKSRIPEGNNGYNKFAEAFLKGKEAIYIKGIPRICNRCKKLLFKKVDAGIQLYDGFTAPKHGIQEAGEYVVKNITTWLPAERWGATCKIDHCSNKISWELYGDDIIRGSELPEIYSWLFVNQLNHYDHIFDWMKTDSITSVKVKCVAGELTIYFISKYRIHYPTQEEWDDR